VWYVLHFSRDSTFDVVGKAFLKDLDERAGTAKAYYEADEDREAGWHIGQIWKKSNHITLNH
jgi:hypothetical protein